MSRWERLLEIASRSPLLVAAGAATTVLLSRSLLRALTAGGRRGKTLVIKVPATTANLSCGFDAFGAALGMHMLLEATAAPEQAGTCFSYEGEGANEVALDESNIIWRSAVACAAMYAPGRQMPKLRVQVKNPVPFGRGLGSSATAIIAGVVLAKEFLGLNLTQEQLLNAALTIETHPDNLSAALWGGMTVSCVNEKGESFVRSFGISKKLKAVVVVPDFQLATSKAREVLPASYKLQDVVFNIQRAGLLPLALQDETPDVKMIRECMRDRVHQNQRAPLVPGLEDCLKLPSTSGSSSLISTALSGAGPTIIAFCQGEFDDIGRKMQETLRSKGISSRYFVLPFSCQGTQVQWI
ncbi:hypothetical protein GUITHDRAFT_165431 [Guillardia theta CCMP2712]|uniref:Homoserine kinase n=2 Tax=Guillardia theta TaxID=55529 RepID=L1INV7_GUITC|nr:hypothetical protein GUITHDRAFT_165431 [Guillardia theta CCMP2712]EKX37569.1 hypothetical protein GUITHDRAFT_165431 [Guillardia theta CCMP2712]|eukprot:XP_005824549.1 hypothetical protein GUITHDRAFT_165431 [Guillardia theta CCMP2712]